MRLILNYDSIVELKELKLNSVERNIQGKSYDDKDYKIVFRVYDELVEAFNSFVTYGYCDTRKYIADVYIQYIE